MGLITLNIITLLIQTIARHSNIIHDNQNEKTLPKNINGYINATITFTNITASENELYITNCLVLFTNTIQTKLPNRLIIQDSTFIINTDITFLHNNPFKILKYHFDSYILPYVKHTHIELINIRVK
jgi:hypothetical protein